MRFVKKPVTVDAIQWTGENIQEIFDFVGNGVTFSKFAGLVIETLEGAHRASINDWIIKGIKGEFYPCKPDIFAATYDEEVTK